MQPEFAFSVFQDEGVVVAFGYCQLFIVYVNVLSDGFRFAEIEGRAFHLAETAVEVLLSIEGGNLLAVHHQFFVKNVFLGMTGNIEERMVGNVQHRRLVGGGFVIYFKGVCCF